MIHYAQPFVMTAHLFTLFANSFIQPLPDSRIIDIVVVYLALVAGVVRRIYVPADFDTIENAFSGAKPPKKAYNKGFRGRFLTSKALFVFIQLECRCQAS